MHQKTVLDNGVRLLTASMPHTRSVSMCIYVGSGSRYEDNEHAGISHFLEHMLFKGTPRRQSAAEITGAIEQVGGMMNGSTDREITAYWCKVATPHFERALDVLVDMVRNPLMEDEEVGKERSVIQEELAMSNDYPGYRVEMLTDQMLWPDHPMGRDVGGSKETVDGITREMMTDWFQHQYVASNVVISIAGSLSHEEMLNAVEPMVKDWPSWITVWLGAGRQRKQAGATSAHGVPQDGAGAPGALPSRHLHPPSAEISHGYDERGHGRGDEQPPLPRGTGETWTGLRYP